MLFQTKDGFYPDINTTLIEAALLEQLNKCAAQHKYNAIPYNEFLKFYNLSFDKMCPGIHVDNLKYIHDQLVETDTIEKQHTIEQQQDKQARRAYQAEFTCMNPQKMVASILKEEPCPVPAKPVLPTVQINPPETAVSPSIGSSALMPQPTVVIHPQKIVYQPKESKQSALPTQSAQAAHPKKTIHHQHHKKPISPHTAIHGGYNWVHFPLPTKDKRGITYSEPVLVWMPAFVSQEQRQRQIQSIQNKFYATHENHHHVPHAHNTHQPKKR